MKKLLAVIALTGLLVSVSAPVLHDSAVETFPRPIVAEQV